MRSSRPVVLAAAGVAGLTGAVGLSGGCDEYRADASLTGAAAVLSCWWWRQYEQVVVEGFGGEPCGVECGVQGETGGVVQPGQPRTALARHLLTTDPGVQLVDLFGQPAHHHAPGMADQMHTLPAPAARVEPRFDESGAHRVQEVRLVIIHRRTVEGRPGREGCPWRSPGPWRDPAGVASTGRVPRMWTLSSPCHPDMHEPRLRTG